MAILINVPNHNPLSYHSRQATLHVAQKIATIQVYNHLWHSLFAIQENGPPRKKGQRPHAIVDRPLSLTPSINPRLGASSRHKELHRCALWRIFRPAFRNGRLTRILHHPMLKTLYHIIFNCSTNRPPIFIIT